LILVLKTQIKSNPRYTTLYLYIADHCNRLGWKEKFGLPTTSTMEAIGIGNYNTYKKTLNDLIAWEFIELITKSKNQYTSNVIALVKNTKAKNKGLLLYGDLGVGKTVLFDIIRNIGRDLLKTGSTDFWFSQISTGSFIDEYMNSTNDRSSTFNLKKYQRSKLYIGDRLPEMFNIIKWEGREQS